MKKVVHLIHPCMFNHRLSWTTVFGDLILIFMLFVLASCQSRGKSVRLAFLGDIMPGREFTLTDSSLEYLEGSLQSADLAMANLESPLTTSVPSSADGYKLCASPENAWKLAQSGLDMLSVVNNHSLDCGNQGYKDTISTLQSSGLVAIDKSGYTTSIHNLKFTFFAFEDISKPLDMVSATRSIQGARSTGAIVIVSIHWGMEYQGGASQRQQELAKQLAKAGATLIWGHHPHVLQPAEWIPPECSDLQDKTGCSLVLYSLGNAFFDQAGLPDTRRSALVSVVFGKKGILSTEVTPFVIDPIHRLVKTPGKSELSLILSRIKLP
ncbi:MAG: CapA family protein [Chloroflexota bacterium]